MKTCCGISVYAAFLGSIALGVSGGQLPAAISHRHDHARLIRLEREVRSLCTHGESSVLGVRGLDGKLRVSKPAATGCRP
jgi:hypothetical protein